MESRKATRQVREFTTTEGLFRMDIGRNGPSPPKQRRPTAHTVSLRASRHREVAKIHQGVVGSSAATPSAEPAPPLSPPKLRGPPRAATSAARQPIVSLVARSTDQTSPASLVWAAEEGRYPVRAAVAAAAAASAAAAAAAAAAGVNPQDRSFPVLPAQPLAARKTMARKAYARNAHEGGLASATAATADSGGSLRDATGPLVVTLGCKARDGTPVRLARRAMAARHRKGPWQLRPGVEDAQPKRGPDGHEDAWLGVPSGTAAVPEAEALVSRDPCRVRVRLAARKCKGRQAVISSAAAPAPPAVVVTKPGLVRSPVAATGTQLPVEGGDAEQGAWAGGPRSQRAPGAGAHRGGRAHSSSAIAHANALAALASIATADAARTPHRRSSSFTASFVGVMYRVRWRRASPGSLRAVIRPSAWPRHLRRHSAAPPPSRPIPLPLCRTPHWQPRHARRRSPGRSHRRARHCLRRSPDAVACWR